MTRKPSLLYDLIMLSAVLIITVAIFFVYRIQSIESRVLEQDLENISKEMEHNYVETVDYTANILGYIARQISQHDNPNDLQYIYTLFKSFRVDPKIRENLSWTIIGWADKNHMAIVDGALGIMKEPYDLSVRDYIPYTVTEPWTIHLGKPVFGSTSNKWIIPAGVGAVDNKGNYLGALVIGFEVEKLKEKFANIVEDKHINFALIGSNKETILHSTKDLKLPDDIVGSVNIKSENSKVFSDIHFFSGENYYIRKLPRYPYAIYLSYDPKVIWQELFKTLKASTFEIGLGIFTLWLLIWYFRKRIVLPIKQLSDAANEITKNPDDVIVPRVPSYEMHSLAKTLTRMKFYKRRDKAAKNKIEFAYNELEKQNKKFKKTAEELKLSNNGLREANARIEELIKIHQEADKEKEEFLRDMYHVLNTPLNAIINGADMARNQMLGSDMEEYQSYFNAIYDAGMQLKCFTTEFLYPELLDIKEVIDRCVRIQKRYASNNGCELISDVSENIPQIWADRLRLRQVILSTLYHSLYHMPEGRQSTISAKVECLADGKPACLIIKIEDNGWGHGQQAREEYWQDLFGDDESESYSRNPDMMKLSLSTIKHIVRLHHGSFDMQAVQGSGSIFTIRIPYMKKEDLLVHPDDYAKPVVRPEVKELPKGENVLKFPGKKNDNKLK